MKNHYPLVIIFALIFLFSCSSNRFTARKNFHPRVKIEGPADVPSTYTAQLPLQTQPETITREKNQSIPNTQPDELKIIHTKKKPSQITKSVSVHKTPQKFTPSSKKLNKTKATHLDDSQVAGLVVSIIALCLAIAAYMMIIWMVNGGLFAGFIVGLVLAGAAIAMGFIGGTLPFRGISWLARVLGILAVIVLMVILVLVLLAVI